MYSMPAFQKNVCFSYFAQSCLVLAMKYDDAARVSLVRKTFDVFFAFLFQIFIFEVCYAHEVMHVSCLIICKMFENISFFNRHAHGGSTHKPEFCLPMYADANNDTMLEILSLEGISNASYIFSRHLFSLLV